MKPSGLIAEKMVRKAMGAQQDYSDGIANPERDPIQAALAANGKRIQKLQESIAKKTWEASMSKLTQSDWQKKAQAVGVGRFAEGVAANADKVQKFWSGMQPLLQSHQDRIHNLPDATEADRVKRMTDNLTGMKALKGKWR